MAGCLPQDTVSNQLTMTGPDGTEAYTYNGFNQQTGYSVGTATASYAYNAKGIRTAKSVGTERTSFLLDGGNVVTEVKNNAISANYVRGTNLISRETDNSVSYYLYNAHGDVIGLTDPNGAVTKTYDYSAFGIEQNLDAADTNPFRYCGEYYDTETGKYYLRARYYDPSLGRFTQADSVQYVHRELPNGALVIDPLSLNHYAYCANNPTRYCDPSGHMAVSVLNSISWEYNLGQHSQASVSFLALFYNLNNIYTAFHEIAQINVAKQLYNKGTPAILEYRLEGIGEVDIVAGKSAWEVKPIRNYGGPRQLRKYTTGTGLTAGEAITEIKDIPIIDDIKMGIKSVEAHPYVIQYYFYRYGKNGEYISVASSEVKKKCEANRDAIASIVRGSLVIAATLLVPSVVATAAGYGVVTDIADFIIATQEAA